MRRRALLAGLAAVAGCSTRLPDVPGGGPTATRTPTPTSPSATATPASTPERTATRAPATPPEVGAAPGEVDCPTPGEAARVVCHPEATDGPLRLRALGAPDLPTGRVRFRLRNEARVPFGFNPYAWALWKRVGGTWHRIVPEEWRDLTTSLAPGAVHSWTLTVDNGRLDGGPLPDPSGLRALTVGGLGGGTYAFTAHGAFVDGAARVGLAARFRIEGPELTLRPTGEVTSVEKRGDRVRVVARPVTGPDYRRARAVVERVEAPDAPEPIVERALRDRVLRDTVPFAESNTQRIELEASTARTPPFGIEAPYTVRVGGSGWRVALDDA